MGATGNWFVFDGLGRLTEWQTTTAKAKELTTVTYRLAVDVKVPMLGMLKRKAEKVIIDTALKGLKKRVESLPA